MPIIELKDVEFQWPKQGGFRLAVSKLSVETGEKLLLLGESGSGKSTLLSLICGVIAPQSGWVKLLSQDMSAMGASKRDRFRAENLGIIFQQFNLLPYANLRDNILLPLHFAPARKARIANLNEAVYEYCEKLKLPRNIINKPARELSVGQQQRTAVARALIGSPSIVVADEPTSSLDAGAQNAFLELLLTQAQNTGSTVLMVSHDERMAPSFDRVLHLEEIIGARS